MDLDQIGRLLSRTISGRWINIPGPGHSSDDRSLGVIFDRFAPDGFHINSLADDPVNECRSYVKLLLKGISLPAHQLNPVGQKTNSEIARRVKEALSLWDNASNAEGSLVERYLNSRGCLLTCAMKSFIRFHAFCPFGSGSAPTMIALMRHIITDEAIGIHRTALSLRSAEKANLLGGSKRMLGSSTHAAVKLLPHDGVLGIAEGIETAISASQLFDKPVWALLSAGGIRRCPLIPGLRELIIFADHDEVGLRAAEECARRYSENGVRACIRHPTTPMTDFNDHQQERTKCP